MVVEQEKEPRLSGVIRGGLSLGRDHRPLLAIRNMLPIQTHASHEHPLQLRLRFLRCLIDLLEA